MEGEGAGVTSGERKVLDALVAAWNAFVELPSEHGDDTPDFRCGIHALQRQIMSRPTRRALKAEE
jgi:hypothetical protein